MHRYKTKAIVKPKKASARVLKRKGIRARFNKSNAVVEYGNGVKFLEVESPQNRIVAVRMFDEDRKQLMKIFAD